MKINGKIRITGLILGETDKDIFEKEFAEWLSTKGLKFGGIIDDEFVMNYDKPKLVEPKKKK